MQNWVQIASPCSQGLARCYVRRHRCSVAPAPKLSAEQKSSFPLISWGLNHSFHNNNKYYFLSLAVLSLSLSSLLFFFHLQVRVDTGQYDNDWHWPSAWKLSRDHIRHTADRIDHSDDAQLSFSAHARRSHQLDIFRSRAVQSSVVLASRE